MNLAQLASALPSDEVIRMGSKPNINPILQMLALKYKTPTQPPVAPDVVDEQTMNQPTATVDPTPNIQAPMLSTMASGYRSGGSSDYAEGLDRHQGGRGTGHFGSGTYFFGDKNKAQSYDERPISEINLDGKNLFKPKDKMEGIELHNLLKEINNYTWGATEKDTRALSIIPQFTQSLRAKGIDITPSQVFEAISETRKDIHSTKRGEWYPKKDTASTRVMKKAGYQGIDVRHIPELDRGDYGSVLYK